MTFQPFLCTKCGYTSFDGQPHKCNPRRQQSSFYSRRYSKCVACKQNNHGICNVDNRNIQYKIQDFYSKCPKDYWLPVIVLCNNCHEININTNEGVSKCIFCGYELENLSNEFFSKDIVLTNKKLPPGSINEYDFLNNKNSVNMFAGSAFVSGSGNPRWLSVSDLMKDTLKLIPKLPKDIDAIIGVSRSGVPSASMLAMMLHLPLYIFRQSEKDLVYAGGGWRIHGLNVNQEDNIQTKHPVVIDDTVFTGSSNKTARTILGPKFDKITFASIYVNPKARNFPDIWSVDLPWPHILEWNVFNSVLTPNSAFDFDGILCEDCKPHEDDDGPNYLNFIENAKPKYIVRKTHIPLIVTARIEKYRPETEEWLRRHKINFNTLIMHPSKTLAERRKEDIPLYKAQHYINFCKKRAAPEPHVFFESDDRQAKRIAQISRKLVVCPSSGRCYKK